jgi:hypothetical protein
MAIQTVEQLRDHLGVALRVELATIPPYLYATWSIEDQGSAAARLLRSIVVEEMLHAALVSNLILAFGGEPGLAGESVVPLYPGPLPHHAPPLVLHLAPCSSDLVRNVFIPIERPRAAGAPPEDDNFESLGQFYMAVEQAIDRLDRAGGLFSHAATERQLSGDRFYGAVEGDVAESGGLVAVTDRASADAAIEIIVHQGEGLRDEKWADPGHRELTHYHKLLQISDGTSPIGQVRQVPTDPRTADYPAAVRPLSDLFNVLYRALFLAMDAAFAGPDGRGAAVGRLYGLMTSLLAPIGRHLGEQPIGGGMMAAPTFELYPLGDEPVTAIREAAARVAPDHPALASQISRIEKMAAALEHPASG